MKVRVLRAFCIGGKRQEPESVVDVPDLLVRELVQMGKAERLEAAAAASGPMTTSTAAPIVKGRTAKEKADVPE